MMIQGTTDFELLEITNSNGRWYNRKNEFGLYIMLFTVLTMSHGCIYKDVDTLYWPVFTIKEKVTHGRNGSWWCQLQYTDSSCIVVLLDCCTVA